MRRTEHYRDPRGVPRTIHIVGLGALGRFIAHSLKEIPDPPPVTLIFHTRTTYRAWKDSPQEIRLTTNGNTVARKGYNAELSRPIPRYHKQEVLDGRRYPPSKKEQIVSGLDAQEMADAPPESFQGNSGEQNSEEGVSNEHIHTLIVSVKAGNTVSALSSLRHRLDASSTILFLHNGMGIIEEVNKLVFPDPATRPFYLLGIITHGLTGDPETRFTSIHAGFGTLALGPYPSVSVSDPSPTVSPTLPASSSRSDIDSPLVLPPNSRYLLRTLLRAPVLTAAAYPPSSLLSLQLEKLAINSVINPLTALLDCRNGGLLYSFPLTRLYRLLLAETSLVLRSLPALRHIPNIESRFSPARLESLVVGIAHRTGQNVSSMLADVREGRRTEIDYINGWVSRKGEELGVRCVVNYSMWCAVKGKRAMVQWEKGEELPFVENLGRPEPQGSREPQPR